MVADVSADVAMAASAIVSGESGEDTLDKGDGKLSLRMKLVTPVEEGSSERFSLQSKSHLWKGMHDIDFQAIPVMDNNLHLVAKTD